MRLEDCGSKTFAVPEDTLMDIGMKPYMNNDHKLMIALISFGYGCSP